MPYPGLLHPEPLPLQQATADPYLHRRHSNTVLAQSLWGRWVLVCTRFVWARRVSLVGMGFDSKCDFAPPTIFLGLLLCPWTWGISSKSLQHCTAAAPWKKSYDQPRQHIKKQRHFFANKSQSSQSYGFSGSHVSM